MYIRMKEMEKKNISWVSSAAVEWYLAPSEHQVEHQSAQARGPFSRGEIYAQLNDHRLSWLDFVWAECLEDWTRLCFLSLFQQDWPKKPHRLPALSSHPQSSPTPCVKPISLAKRQALQVRLGLPLEWRNAELEEEEAAGVGRSSPGEASAALPPHKSAAKKGAQERRRKWFLHFEQTQFGPYAREDLEWMLAAGQVSETSYCWQEGMKSWKKMNEIKYFSEWFKRKRQAAGGVVAMTSKDQRRQAPRAPLVATVRVSQQAKAVIGVCRDISVGGMQILMDCPDWQVGRRLKLHLSFNEPRAVGLMGPGMASFVAEGEIVRLLADHRGFSFRFLELSARALRAIEAYVGALHRGGH